MAIAITANFKNNRTTAEAVVEEISGVAFVYKQDFFNNLYEELGIALENIVYYKDETHYFVMTTKKHSLLDRGVLLKVMTFMGHAQFYISNSSWYLIVSNAHYDKLSSRGLPKARFGHTFYIQLRGSPLDTA